MSLLTGATVGACLAWLGWLVVEQRRARRHRAALAHVVHVNGIRRKSSVSRLIDAGLRAGGRRVLTKTTGTRPRFIDVDGQERPVHRRGQASIREQLATLRRAAQQGAEVLVVSVETVKTHVKRILRKYKYPQDRQEEAVNVVLQQAEALGEVWT